jgi:hypothetical protein
VFDDLSYRRYRLLLLAYPRWHRRLHGADMLTALLDAAADRKTAPVCEAFILVGDGLRCRLRVRGVAATILAAALSLIGAGTLAAAAGWIGWHATAAPWPSVDRAIHLAGPVLPAGPPQTVTRRDDPIGPWKSDADSVLLTLLGSPELRPGGVQLDYVQPRTADRMAAYTATADRLAAAGWQTIVIGGRLVANRDGLRITLLYANRDAATEDLIVTVYPVPPPLSYRLATLGAAVGAAFGWLVAASAVARTRRRTLPTRVSVSMLAVAGAIISGPACLLTLATLIVADSDLRATPPWTGYDFAFARPGAAIGALLLTAALYLSTRPTTARTTTLAHQPATGQTSDTTLPP